MWWLGPLLHLPGSHAFVNFLRCDSANRHILGVWRPRASGPMTPKFELGRDFCTMHLTAKFHHPTFNCSEVILLTNKQTPLKTVISLRCATPVGNKLSNQYTSSTFMSLWNSDKSKRHTNILNGDFNHEDPTKQPTNITQLLLDGTI